MAVSAPPAAVEGRLEGVLDGRVLGWAWSPDSPAERIWVSVFVDDEPAGLAAADLERPDLHTAGIGDGAHGFIIALSPELRDGGEHTVRVVAGRSNTPLPAASGFIIAGESAAVGRHTNGASRDPTGGVAGSSFAPAHREHRAQAPSALPAPRVATPGAALDALLDRARRQRATALEPARAWVSTRRDAPTEDLLRRNAPQAVLVAALLINLVVLLVATQHLGFFQDDFLFILYKRGWSPDTFLAAMNGHLSLMPVAIFKLLFVVVGIAHSWPYRLVLVGIDSACVVLVYRLLAPRAGQTIALVLALLLLMLGSGTGITDLVWVTQIGFLLSLAAGVAALGYLRAGDRRSDRRAAALLLVSLASSSPSLAICAGALAYMLATHAASRRYWVVLAPLALYALWYLGYGTQGLLLSNVPQLPNYLVHIASAGIGALVGVRGHPQITGIDAALLAAAVIMLALRAWRSQPFSALSLAGLAGALTFWISVGLTRAQTDNAVNSRYLYPSAVFILIALGGLLSWRRPTTRGAALVVCGLLFVGAGDLGSLESAVEGRTKMDNEVRTVLGAAEVIGRTGNPDFKPNPPFVPYLPLGVYLSAVRQLGSPALTPVEIQTQGAANRRLADRTIIAGEQLGVERAPQLIGATPPAVQTSSNVTVTSSPAGASCLTATPTAAGASIDLTVASGGALYLSLLGKGTLTLYVRRLAAGYPQQPLGVFPSSDGPRGVGFPADAGRLPWHVRLLPTAPLTACLSSVARQ